MIAPGMLVDLTFTWQESARQSQVCVKRRGHLFFCKQNKKLLFFWLLLQYTWSGILNLIKIIHVPQSIEGDTPLRTACRPISALRTAYHHVLASRTAYRLIIITKTTIFGNFIYIKKIKWQYVAQTLNLVFLLVRFPSFRYPQTNVYVNKCLHDPQKARA